MKKLILLVVLVSYVWVAAIEPGTLGCPLESTEGGDCRKCIVNRIKYECPSCGGMLGCMAKCLWSRKPKAVCLKRCDCSAGHGGHGAYPNLSDCKKCMLNCRCSCISY